MHSLREEITKTFLRFTRVGESRGRPRRNPDERVSRQYGPYRVIKSLGEGGMGQVYLALDTRLGRHVALKFLPAELTNDFEFLARFEREALAASALNHPNIVTIYDFTDIDAESILVSEFIEGGTLRMALDRDALPIEAGLRIAIQVASALGAAHAVSIVHRDLKPSNIMIRPDGYVKVIDFGLAKFGARRSGRVDITSWTRRGSVLGTVEYMSPEQARGEDVDWRTDIWSLGVILYELVTGRRPFEGKTESHIIVGILDQQPPPITEPDMLPPGLAAVIERALQKRPEDRYRSVNEMLADLQAIQTSSGFAANAKVFAAPRVMESRATLNKALAGSAIVCLVALISLAVWWWGFNGQERMLGPHWFEVASSRRVTFEGDVSLAAISLNGRYLAFISGRSGSAVLHVRNLQNGKENHLRPIQSRYTGLTFSPDNQTLFFVSADEQRERGRLYALPLRPSGNNGAGPDGSIREPSGMVLEDIDGAIAFSPDGHEFAYMRVARGAERSVNEIWIGNDRNSHDAQRIVSLAGTQITDRLAWLPRRNTIAAVTYPVRLNAPTQANVSLYDRQGKLLKTYVPDRLRSLFLPVAIDGGTTLLFSGTPQGAQERHLVQLYLPTGQFHETQNDVAGIDSITATSDGNTVAAVRDDQRSSVWIADAKDLSNAQKVVRDSEWIPQVAWAGLSELVFPSERTGNVNLAKLKPDGSIEPLGPSGNCVQAYPNSGRLAQNLVAYASNCAHGGDDFNIWTLDLKSGLRRQLTSGSTYDYQPDVSPDGKWIIYTSWSSNVQSIWKMPFTGGVPVRLSQMQGRRPYVSPDGARVVAQIRETGGPWEVAVLSIEDGSVLQRFPRMPIVNVTRWNPDGTAIDYVNSRPGSEGIWRQPLSGGPPQRLTSASEDEIAYFTWNADGTKLAYIVTRQQKDVVLFSRQLRKQ